MKTTLVIDDQVMRRVRQEAAVRGTTISGIVESALRTFLEKKKRISRLAPLPTFDSGGAYVDVADRDALYQAMEGR